jgi:hypothetical protein
MSKNAPIEILGAGLLEHPAVKAWNELQPARVEPESLEILQEHKKAAVYRLIGVGPRGVAVIAKRCLMATARIERTIYEEVLPHLPIPAPHYYGFLEEDDAFCWLFLEDAGKERLSPLIEEHRVLAARWLGLMHASAARVTAAARLPDGGPNRYLEHLKSAREAILNNLTNPALGAGDMVILNNIVAHCDLLESRWCEVEKCCAEAPSTLVHGDFRPKNIYVRTDRAGTNFFTVDWETAGWGVPAADLAPSRGRLPVHQIDIAAYWSIVHEHWPHLPLHSVERLALVGRIFRRLAAIYWESRSLAFGTERLLCGPMACMRVYQAELAEAICEIPWASE